MAEKTHRMPSWFNKALENQDVSKDVLLHFKEHYLTANGKEEHDKRL